MKKFFKEFKEFAMKGNVIDLAIAVIIGGAFGKIVTSLVNDIFMPVIGLITGGKNVKSMFAILGNVDPSVAEGIKSVEDAAEAGVATLNYGLFIQTIIDFILVALCLFLVVKAINKSKDMKKKEEAPAEEPTTKKCPFCQSEIDINATRCPHCTSELKE